MNGSDATGGCPHACVQSNSYCDCAGTAGAGTFTGVIIDGVVPTLDTSQRGTWATQLFTVRDNTQITRIGFRFQNAVMLREVELYLFYCPSWGIGGSPGGTNTINIYNAVTFPLFVDSFGGSVGSVTLTSDMVNCESLIRVSIPLQGARSISIYFIEFSSTDLIGWINIAEVRFADELIPSASSTDPIPGPSVFVKYTLLTLSITTSLSPTPVTSPLLQTEDTTTSVTPSSSTTIILVVIIVVLVVTGSVVFTAMVCVMKKIKSSSRGVAREGDVDREYEDVQELDEPHEVIETKSNEAYSHVGAGGVEMVRNEAYTTFMAEREEINDVTYEEIKTSQSS